MVFRTTLLIATLATLAGAAENGSPRREPRAALPPAVLQALGPDVTVLTWRKTAGDLQIDVEAKDLARVAEAVARLIAGPCREAAPVSVVDKSGGVAATLTCSPKVSAAAEPSPSEHTAVDLPARLRDALGGLDLTVLAWRETATSQEIQLDVTATHNSVVANGLAQLNKGPCREAAPLSVVKRDDGIRATLKCVLR